MEQAQLGFTPFDPDNEADYTVWRDRKLAGYPAGTGELK